MGMTILAPGPLTTVQDLGRRGYLSSGICPSGAMDIPAAIAANTLAENDPAAAVLEMTMGGITAQFDRDARFALTGADMDATLNGVPVAAYTAVTAHAGDALRCGFARTGCRGYFAVQGGIDVPLVLGSRSTHIKCKIGGFQGRPLRTGDVLSFGEPAAYNATNGRSARAANAAPVLPPEPWVIRVTKGPQADRVPPAAQKVFFSGVYRALPQSDRMGIRLEGPPLVCPGGTDIISDGIPAGAIQVPDSGLPIILLADRQTTGGYAKPWVVVSADHALLAQARPGTALRFAALSGGTARRLAARL
jgi:biotin-dependent carboxylase-like uncharacterized protein